VSATVALYGGSFNPPHVGHVMATAWILSACDVDAVWWVPVGQHAFAKRRHHIAFAHRAKMAELATALFGARARVTDVELRMGGESRTVDTVRQLQSEHPELQLRTVIGTDILGERHLWKEFDALGELAPFLLLGRQGYPTEPGWTASPPLPDVSSSEIRQRVQTGQPIDGLVPRAVAAYIGEHGLYRDPTP
jgi:nicotinate-nucleotide adenylyltransferase